MSVADPLSLLKEALSQPSDTLEQLTALQSLRDALESQPSRIPMLMRVSGVVSSINRDRGHNGTLRTWVLDMLAYTFGKAPIPLEEKTLGE
jgi:symplekin